MVSLLPWSVRIPVGFMVTGWMRVQCLLTLLHIKDIDEAEIASIVEAAGRLQPILRPIGRRPVLAITAVVLSSLPSLLYLTTFLGPFLEGLPHGLATILAEALGVWANSPPGSHSGNGLDCQSRR